jgi:hypothetical protein
MLHGGAEKSPRFIVFALMTNFLSPFFVPPPLCQVKASKTAKKATVAKFIVECSEPVDEGVLNTFTTESRSTERPVTLAAR